MKRDFTNRYIKLPLKAILLSLLIIFVCAAAFCGCVSAEDSGGINTWAELKAALEDQTGNIQTVTLSQDINESATEGIAITANNATVINKTKILNLNGHTINISGENDDLGKRFPFLITEGGSLTVNGNGKIECNKRLFKLENGTLNLENGEFINLNVIEDSKSMIAIYGSEKENNNNRSKFTLGETAKLMDGDWAIGIFNNKYPCKGDGYQIVVDIKGNITTCSSGISPNGNLQPKALTNNVPQIHIYPKAVINAPKGTAIYGAGYCNWIFDEGCNVTGSEALSIKSGNWTINGGTFEATGEYNMPPTAQGSASEPSGAAVSITHGGTTATTYANNVSLIINGGTFISEKQAALFEGKNNALSSTSALDEKGITINGGEFITKNSSKLYPIHIMNLENKQVSVTLNDLTSCYPGLNTSSAAWVKGTDGNWTVTVKEDITNLESINLTLIDDSKKATLELNGHSIKSDNKGNLIGWNSTSSTGNVIDLKQIDSTEFKGSKAYYPLFEYNVTFNENGGTGTMDNQPFVYNASQKLNANNFTKDGYVFAGWNTKADGSGTSYTNEQPITIDKDTTLYAVWTLKPKEYETGEEVEDDEPTPTIEPILTAEPTPIVTPTQNQTVTPTQNQTVKPTVKPTPEPKTVVIVETEVKFEDNKVITSITVPEGSSGSITFTQTEEKGMDEWIPESTEDSYSFDLSCDGEINGDSEIHFVMSDVILKSLGLTPEDVCLKHFENGVWVKLKISYIVLDDGTYYYTAVTKSFSPFEISFDAKSEEPTATPTEEQPAASPMPLLGLLMGLGAAALLVRRK